MTNNVILRVINCPDLRDDPKRGRFIDQLAQSGEDLSLGIGSRDMEFWKPDAYGCWAPPESPGAQRAAHLILVSMGVPIFPKLSPDLSPLEWTGKHVYKGLVPGDQDNLAMAVNRIMGRPTKDSGEWVSGGFGDGNCRGDETFHRAGIRAVKHLMNAFASATQGRSDGLKIYSASVTYCPMTEAGLLQLLHTGGLHPDTVDKFHGPFYPGSGFTLEIKYCPRQANVSYVGVSYGTITTRLDALKGAFTAMLEPTVGRK